MAVAAVAVAVGALLAVDRRASPVDGPVAAAEDPAPPPGAAVDEAPDRAAVAEAPRGSGGEVSPASPAGSSAAPVVGSGPRPPASVLRREAAGRAPGATGRRAAPNSEPVAAASDPPRSEPVPDARGASQDTAPDPAAAPTEAGEFAVLAVAPRAVLGPVAAVSEPVPLRLAPRSVTVRRDDPGARVRVVAGSAAGFASGQDVEGVGVTTGLIAEVAVGRGVSLSGGALAAYDQFAVEPDRGRAADLIGPPESAGAAADGAEIPTRTARTTVAVELPLDVSLAVAQTRRARLAVSVGVTSAVVISEEVDVEGRRYLSMSEGGRDGQFASVGFDETAAAPAGRVDLARQINLGVTLSPRRPALPLSLEGFARLPLRTVTEGDVPLTIVGVRLRYDL